MTSRIASAFRALLQNKVGRLRFPNWHRCASCSKPPARRNRTHSRIDVVRAMGVAQEVAPALLRSKDTPRREKCDAPNPCEMVRPDAPTVRAEFTIPPPAALAASDRHPDSRRHVRRFHPLNLLSGPAGLDLWSGSALTFVIPWGVGHLSSGYRVAHSLPSKGADLPSRSTSRITATCRCSPCL